MGEPAFRLLPVLPPLDCGNRQAHAAHRWAEDDAEHEVYWCSGVLDLPLPSCRRCGLDRWDTIHDTRNAIDFSKRPPQAVHPFEVS